MSVVTLTLAKGPYKVDGNDEDELIFALCRSGRSLHFELHWRAARHARPCSGRSQDCRAEASPPSTINSATSRLSTRP